MKKFHQEMRRIQQFWRTCSERMARDRKAVGRRWKAVEKHILGKELNVAEPMPDQMEQNRGGRRGSQTQAPRRLSLDERVGLAMMDDGRRTEFIRNEMRTRRY